MSFPISRPDRRIVQRRRFAQPCRVEFARGGSAPAILSQLDLHGARLRLLQRPPGTCGDLRIVTAEGSVVFGAAAWRIDDVVGVRLHARSAARIAAFEDR